MKNCSTSKSARATNARRNSLKSLLTLASGAASLGALAPSAEAGKADIVYTPFGTGMTVGFGGGQEASVTRSLPGGATITLNREAKTDNASNRILARIVGVGGAFARQPNSRSAATNPQGTNVALRTAYGKNWNDAARNASGTFGNIILSTITSNFLVGPGTFNTTKYLLFKFTDTSRGNQTEYGWIGMSAATYTGDKLGMSVTFTGWAYDNSGAVIFAGDKGLTPVPEVSTGVVSALMAAMFVGGVELRRWRKSKPANASQPA